MRISSYVRNRPITISCEYVQEFHDIKHKLLFVRNHEAVPSLAAIVIALRVVGEVVSGRRAGTVSSFKGNNLDVATKHLLADGLVEALEGSIGVVARIKLS